MEHKSELRRGTKPDVANQFWNASFLNLCIFFSIFYGKNDLHTAKFVIKAGFAFIVNDFFV
jgi:hypothetical protein